MAVRLGIDTLMEKRRDLLRGRRVGVVSNYAMVDSALRPVIDVLTKPSTWRVAKLFGPEHGVKNSAREGEHVVSGTDAHTGLPAYSLYGENRRPTVEMVSDLDVLVIDLWDIGCRYYTNMNTVANCMEVCAEAGISCVVLDRPNPLGGVMREGNILRDEYRSFVGGYALPVRHGLTMGELARLFAREIPDSDLTVVPLQGWRRSMLHPDTGLPFIPPSPNTTGFSMVFLYPGTCLFEGTNVSVGRGTTHPFEVIGAPFVDGHQLASWFNERRLPGVLARPVYFAPHYSLYRGELCQGVQLHVSDPVGVQAMLPGLTLLQGIAELYPEQMEFLGEKEQRRPFFDLLAGTDGLRPLVRSGRALEFLSGSADIERFTEQVQDVLLYPDEGGVQ